MAADSGLIDKTIDMNDTLSKSTRSSARKNIYLIQNDSCQHPRGRNSTRQKLKQTLVSNSKADRRFQDADHMVAGRPCAGKRHAQNASVQSKIAISRDHYVSQQIIAAEFAV